MDSINQALSQAVQLHQAGNIEESEKIYRQILEQQPDNPDALHFLGVIAMQVGKPEDSIRCIRQAIKINPNNADYYVNLGTAYSSLSRHAETAHCYEKALELNPNFAEVHYNLGKTQEDQGKMEEAVASYSKALEVKPNSVRFHVNRSLAMLKAGDYEMGWAEYEWRWQDPRARVRSFVQLPWDGADLSGRTIFLHAEQSLSDTIQMLRYIPLVKELNAEVILECQPPLKNLLQNTSGIDHLISYGEEIPNFDVHTPLMSLPRIFRTTLETIPAEIPYLQISSEKSDAWRERLNEIEGKKIGLSWLEDPRHPQAQKRSIPLSQFSSLANLSNASFVNLQVGLGPETLAKVIEAADAVELHNLQFTEKDNPDLLLDVAAVIVNLDLIITADTIIAHLAGALGKEVYLLLPSIPDWRWLQDRDDSPWYPNIKLFRQQEGGDWEKVVEEVRAAVERWSTT